MLIQEREKFEGLCMEQVLGKTKRKFLTEVQGP